VPLSLSQLYPFQVERVNWKKAGRLMREVSKIEIRLLNRAPCMKVVERVNWQEKAGNSSRIQAPRPAV
jgi:hypothetical protein